ncbi:unnamed protein product [Echinostoma caproni]|uniref:Amino acid transporter transmembrane domain-containing protein n=1 Tax=Echinostoma caproni TaxID=27848 RepID=A0A3P8I0K4_9TREM|nr:unnamed protein product [Echinostoma caproni]
MRIVMLALLTVAITPLCLVPRVQSLIRMSAFAMIFYLAMLLHLLTIYTGLHQPSVTAMHDVVRSAVAIVAVAYGLFGFMGYVAFAHLDKVPGNVFLLYPDDPLSFCVQAGFLFTITVSIPLTLFPLRRSLDSFIFHQRHPSVMVEPDGAMECAMPAKRFRVMTICILVLCFSLSLTTDKILSQAPLVFSNAIGPCCNRGFCTKIIAILYDQLCFTGVALNLRAEDINRLVLGQLMPP